MRRKKRALDRFSDNVFDPLTRLRAEVGALKLLAEGAIFPDDEHRVAYFVLTERILQHLNQYAETLSEETCALIREIT